jgi:hypothetical protein
MEALIGFQGRGFGDVVQPDSYPLYSLKPLFGKGLKNE